ncbi:MAG: acetolactate synthase small subunit [Oscillospiraceae bacterium]|nr:acetolactate synthase small subunit [Oscillospiraceae bacterium]
MKGIFSVLVENKDGVLSSIAGLFARRGFNIDSLAVGETDDRTISSMTIVSTGDQRTIDQIEKQLNKKVDVIKVRRLSETKSISLEMMLVKVACTAATRSAVIDLCQITGAKIMKVSPKFLLLEYHDEPEGVEDFIDLIKGYGILDIQRTGTISMSKS